MTWFEALTGFAESEAAVYRHLEVDGVWLRSHVNGRSARIGELSTPSLGELRYRCDGLPTGEIEVSLVKGDVVDLHADPANTGAFFQVASQFNLLEMVSPTRTPEDGVSGYEDDRTQGPACAVACGAGTIYRNWFVPTKGQTGQTKSLQLDMLADVGSEVGNYGADRLWLMKNGYALPVRPVGELPEVHDMLRIGIQSGVEVTLPGAGHLVSQAYCSAVPVSYSSVPVAGFPSVEPFARMVLNSAYEATLAAAWLHAASGASRVVFLTLLGAGAFGNPVSWVWDALVRAVGLYEDAPLDVRVVVR